MLKLKCESLVDLSKVKSVNELERGKPVARMRLPSGDGVYLSVVEDMRGKYFGSSAFEEGKNGIPSFSNSVYDVGDLCGKGAWEVTHILWHEALNFLADGDIRMFSDKQEDCKSLYEGTLVVTDPCYLDADDNSLRARLLPLNADTLKRNGMLHCDCASTLYGDWGCDMFGIHKERSVSKFCADAGMVCLVLMEEAEKFSPGFPKWAEEHEWCASVIPDFEGEAYILHVAFPDESEGKDEESAYVLTLGSHDLVSGQTSL